MWNGWLIRGPLGWWGARVPRSFGSFVRQRPLELPVRAMTSLNRFLELPGVRVIGGPGRGGPGVVGRRSSSSVVVVDVALPRRTLLRPVCSSSISRRYDWPDVDSSWRHRDLGGQMGGADEAAPTGQPGAWGDHPGGPVRWFRVRGSPPRARWWCGWSPDRTGPRWPRSPGLPGAPWVPGVSDDHAHSAQTEKLGFERPRGQRQRR